MTIFTPVSELSDRPKGNVEPGQALFEVRRQDGYPGFAVYKDEDPGNSIGLVAQEAASKQQMMLISLEMEVTQLKKLINSD